MKKKGIILFEISSPKLNGALLTSIQSHTPDVYALLQFPTIICFSLVHSYVNSAQYVQAHLKALGAGFQVALLCSPAHSIQM
jgi:hypothetical protein